MFRYQNWKEGQHYDGKDEQCGIIYQQYDWGRWDDDNCYKPLGYICKRREYRSYTTGLSLSRSVLITYPPPPLPFVGSESWRLTCDYFGGERGVLKRAFQCILSDRERNFSHEDDSFIYPYLLQSNKSFGIQNKMKYDRLIVPLKKIIFCL